MRAWIKYTTFVEWISWRRWLWWFLDSPLHPTALSYFFPLVWISPPQLSLLTSWTIIDYSNRLEYSDGDWPPVSCSVEHECSSTARLTGLIWVTFSSYHPLKTSSSSPPKVRFVLCVHHVMMFGRDDDLIQDDTHERITGRWWWCESKSWCWCWWKGGDSLSTDPEVERSPLFISDHHMIISLAIMS